MQPNSLFAPPARLLPLFRLLLVLGFVSGASGSLPAQALSPALQKTEDIRAYIPYKKIFAQFAKFVEDHKDQYQGDVASCKDAMVAKVDYYGRGPSVDYETTTPALKVTPKEEVVDKVTTKEHIITRLGVHTPLGDIPLIKQKIIETRHQKIVIKSTEVEIVQLHGNFRILRKPVSAPPGIYFEDHKADDENTGCFAVDEHKIPLLCSQHIVRLYRNDTDSKHYLRWVFVSESNGKVEEGDFLTPTEVTRFLATRSPLVRELLNRFFFIQKTVPVLPSVMQEPHELANAPAYPAKIVGSELQATGSTSEYQMILDPAFGGTKPKGTLALDQFDYTWTVYNITDLVKKGISKEAMERLQEESVGVSGKTITEEDAGYRDLARRLENVGEDTKHAAVDTAKAAAQVGVTAATRQKADVAAMEQVVVNSYNLLLTPASVIVELGGWLVHQTAGVVYGKIAEKLHIDLNGQEIPWPEDGVFLLRCTATPRVRGNLKRAVSVTSKVVEVHNSAYLARNLLDKPYAEMEEIALRLLVAQDPQERADLQAQLNALRLQVYGSVEDVLKQQALPQAEAHVKLANQGTCLPALSLLGDLFTIETKSVNTQLQKTYGCVKERGAAKEEVTRLQKLLALAQKRTQEFWDAGAKGIYRVQATFASEETSVTYPLLLQLGRVRSSDDLIHWRLSDVTNAEGEVYEGAGFSDEEAIWDALRRFANGNDYQRGSLAVRLPGEFLLKGLTKRSGTLRNAPRGDKLLKNRTADLTVVLTALSFFVPGAGQVAMILSGIASADRLYKQYQNDNLTFSAQTVSDVIAVLGAAGTGLGSVGQFRLVRAQKAFALAKKEGDMARLAGLAARVENANAFYQKTMVFNEFIGQGGLIWGNAEALVALGSITVEELAGSITHTQARRMRIQHILGAIQNNAMYLHGLARARAGSAAEGQFQELLAELPPVEITPEQFRRGVLEPSPAERTQFRTKVTRALEAASQEGSTSRPGQELVVQPQGAGEVPLQGAARGSKVYKPSTSTKQIEAGTPEFHGELDQIRIRTVEGAKWQQKPTVQATSGTSSYELQVPIADKLVPVQVEIKTIARAPRPDRSVHGSDTGNAVFELVREGGPGGTWKAEVSVYERVVKEDVKHLVGHEINEISDLVQKLHNLPEGEYLKQKEVESRASVFRPEGGEILSAHDRTTAHELFGLYEEYLPTWRGRDEKTVPIGRIRNTLEEQSSRIERLLEAMGVQERVPGTGNKTEYAVATDERVALRIDATLQTLELYTQKYLANDSVNANAMRKMFREKLWSMRAEATAREFNQSRSGQVQLSPEQIKHILYPEPNTGSSFASKGIGGGHLDAELMKFQAENPQYYFNQIGRITIDGVEIIKYEQWRYKDGKTPPPTHDPRPGYSRDWQLALVGRDPTVKTTVSSEAFLLKNGMRALERWLRTPGAQAEIARRNADHKLGNPSGSDIKWSMRSGDPKESFGGYVRYQPDGSGVAKAENFIPVTIYAEL